MQPSTSRLSALFLLAPALLGLGCGSEPDTTPDNPLERGVLLVGNTRGDNVVRLDEETGAFLGDFIAKGSGGLVAPDAIVFGTDDDLYVASGDTLENSAVLRYDGETGKFIGKFASGHGLLRPYGMLFGPNGRLYVSSFLSDQILRFDQYTGEFVDVFATGDGKPGGLNGPNALTVGLDGKLYVSTEGSVAVNGEPTFPGLPSQVLRYDMTTGESEVFIDQPELSPAGAGYISLLGLEFGPDCTTAPMGECDLFVSDFANDIRRYDRTTGKLKATLSTSYTGTPTKNNLGGLVFGTEQRLYTVGFDSTEGSGALGAVLRFDANSNAPLPAANQAGAIFVPTDSRLVRPIGIAFAFQND